MASTLPLNPHRSSPPLTETRSSSWRAIIIYYSIKVNEIQFFELSFSFPQFNYPIFELVPCDLQSLLGQPRKKCAKEIFSWTHRHLLFNLHQLTSCVAHFFTRLSSLIPDHSRPSSRLWSWFEISRFAKAPNEL